MWSDIDYMDRFRIFTTDPVNYPQPQLKAFIDGLHANDQHYVQLIDPGVSSVNYSVYNDGVAKKVFVTRAYTNEPLVNVVWPGWTVFPDFTGERPSAWWHEQLSQYMQKVPLDGVWLDMNELGTFCGGYCPVPPGTEWKVDWWTVNWDSFESEVCVKLGKCVRVDSSLNFPTVNPLTNGRNLFTRTLDMTAQLALGSYYDTKSFYSLMECRVTYESLLKQKKGVRPFILTRSSFPGTGRYAAKWTGDNEASWGPSGLWDSVQGVLAPGLWGMNVVGADIGGFTGTASEALVVRWTQMGAYYTFMRNHHGLDHNNQEWYRYSDNAVKSFRQAISDRYQLLPYTFSQLLQTYFEGGPVLRHPAVQYPLQPATYHERTTFFLGPDIYVIPVVDENAWQVTAYVPQGRWYSMWTGDLVSAYGGTSMTFACHLYDRIPVLLRGGAAISLHTKPAMTVKETRASGISVVCALDHDGVARGTTYFDDGKDSLLTTQDALFRVMTDCRGSVTAGGVRITVGGSGPRPHTLPLKEPAFVRVLFHEPIPNPSQLEVSIRGLGPISTFEVVKNRLEVRLPPAMDGTSVLTLTWSTRQ